MARPVLPINVIFVDGMRSVPGDDVLAILRSSIQKRPEKIRCDLIETFGLSDDDVLAELTDLYNEHVIGYSDKSLEIGIIVVDDEQTSWNPDLPELWRITCISYSNSLKSEPTYKEDLARTILSQGLSN